MKIIVTGSLGRISKPLTEQLVQKGHNVIVVSRDAEKQPAIEDMEATAALGSVEDVEFLTNVFTGADIVYLMEPPPDFLDNSTNTAKTWTNIARSYAVAVKRSGVKKVVHLSSIGAHTDKGNGMLAGHHLVENILGELPADVSIKFMRPVGFYYNMFAFIPGIKAAGSIFQNYGGDEKEPWVSPLDIADVIAEELEKPFDGRIVRYIASDEVSPNEVAQVLGEAIGNPALKWVCITDEQFLQALLAAGFGEKSAHGLTDMNKGRRENLYEDYNRHRPILGKVKLADFAKEFSTMFNQSNK